jgi:hypothetical protein
MVKFSMLNTECSVFSVQGTVFNDGRPMANDPCLTGEP